MTRNLIFMKTLDKYLILFLFALFLVAPLCAQRKMEYLDRGLFAMPDGKGNVFVSWRLLVTDPANKTFRLYRSENGGKAIELTKKSISETHFTDNNIDSNKTYTY